MKYPFEFQSIDIYKSSLWTSYVLANQVVLLLHLKKNTNVFLSLDSFPDPAI